MNSVVNILHLSDLHYDKTKLTEYNQKVLLSALLKDIKNLSERSLKPDVVIFSGDLVQDGDDGVDNYYYLYDDFLEELIKITRCGEQRIFFCPGNHDAQRSFIKHNFRAQRSLQSAAVCRDALNEAYLNGRLSELTKSKFAEFEEFSRTLRLKPPKYHDGIIRIDSVEGFPIDVIVMNTSFMTWGGLADLGSDERNLLFPEAAVVRALENSNESNLQVFVSHHPPSWLTEFAETDFRNTLRSKSEKPFLHLFGHLHEARPQQVSQLQGTCLTSQAGALYCGRERYNGYSIITLDISNPNPVINLRSYFDQSREFNAGLDLAPDGGVFFPSPAARHFWRQIEKRVDRPALKSWVESSLMPAARKEFDAGLVDKSLCEVFVEPPIFKASVVDEGGEDDLPERTDESVLFSDMIGASANFVIYSPHEYGKTTLLQQVALKLMRKTEAETDFLTVPILVNFGDIRPGGQPVERALRNSLQVDFPDSSSLSQMLSEGLVTVLIDDVDFKDEQKIGFLRKFMDVYSKNRFFLTSIEDGLIENSIVFGQNVVPDAEALSSFEHVYLKQFTRRKMRNLVKKWGQNTKLDEESILNRLVKEMAAIHIPPTAINGSILLTIYESQPGFIPINRANMIDRFLEHILEKRSLKEALRGTFDYTNKRYLLSYLAEYMVMNDSYALNTEEVVGVFRKYLEGVGLVEDPNAIFRNFVEARVLAYRPDESVTFRYRAFLEYFIASQMGISESFKAWVLEEDRYLSFVNELNYYAGVQRDDAQLLNLVGERFSRLTDGLFGQLDWDLDPRVLETFLPPRSGSESDLFDDVEEQLSGPSLAPEDRDEMFETDLPQDAERRQEVFRPDFKDAGQKWIMCLIIYSGMLKNLELIPSETKREHLSVVLHGWSYLTVNTIYLVPMIAKHRRYRVNGVLYDVRVPRHYSTAEVARTIYFEIPSAVSRLVTSFLGSEKLQRQLTQPDFADQGEPLIVSFYRNTLIADLKLPGWLSAIEKFAKSNIDARYLRESFLRKLSETYFVGGHDLEIESSLRRIAGELLGSLRGHTKKDRQRITGKAIQKIERKAHLRQLHISAQERAENSGGDDD